MSAKDDGLPDVLRCAVTKNPCGTDTWMAESSCPCAACQAYLRLDAMREVLLVCESALAGVIRERPQTDAAPRNIGLASALELVRAALNPGGSDRAAGDQP